MYVQETWKFRQSYYAKFEVYGDKEVWKLTHDQRWQTVALIVPDNADVHVDAALEKICGALNPLGAKRRVEGVLRQKFQFVF